MPVNISPSLIRKLPADERENVEEVLWTKSGGFCHLCLGRLNRAADAIEADHDIPEADGGPTTLANLKLAHRECNRAKRDAGTSEIRAYLRLRRFIRDHGGRLKYGGVLDHFEIEPGSVSVVDGGAEVQIQFPDGSERSAPVFSEMVGDREVRYIFMDLPQSAIHSDSNVQPRVLQERHAKAIYQDLMRNPLYEPPGCRVVPDSDSVDSLQKILMFDGQHKTVACWMMGRKSVVAKVFLEMTAAEANMLVNSIQAKIRKLALSAFEISAKMADEFEHKMKDYEQWCEEQDQILSEKGFIDWLPHDDQKRGRNALEEARISNVIDSDDLSIVRYVKRPGGDGNDQFLTESQLKNKLVKPLLKLKPMIQDVTTSVELRRQEATNIVRVLNMFSDGAFSPDLEDGTHSPKQEIVAQRFKYQGALSESARLILDAYAHTMILSDPHMWGKPSDEMWATIEEAIERLVKHPVWYSDLSEDPKLEAVQTALSKNQDLKASLGDVGLGLSYLIVGTDDSAYETFWNKRKT